VPSGKRGCSFLRARKPEEKEVRRQALLAAARALMQESGAVEFSLSELGRRSGVSKPNIYRYFESREEVLLEVWVEEVRGLATALESAFGRLPVGDVSATAQAIVDAFTARPQLCELLAIVSPVLERNLSAGAILTAKRTLAALTVQWAAQLHGRLPAIALPDCAWAASTIATYVAGIWPAVRPGPALAEVMALPELCGMQPRFARDFLRFVEVLFAGLQQRGGP
jgi:AcrR family transcriptional regulator